MPPSADIETLRSHAEILKPGPGVFVFLSGNHEDFPWDFMAVFQISMGKIMGKIINHWSPMNTMYYYVKKWEFSSWKMIISKYIKYVNICKLLASRPGAPRLGILLGTDGSMGFNTISWSDRLGWHPKIVGKCGIIPLKWVIGSDPHTYHIYVIYIYIYMSVQYPSCSVLVGWISIWTTWWSSDLQEMPHSKCPRKNLPGSYHDWIRILNPGTNFQIIDHRWWQAGLKIHSVKYYMNAVLMGHHE